MINMLIIEKSEVSPMPQTAAKKVTIWNRTFICCLLANVFLYLGQNIVNPLVTTYAAYIGAGASIIGMISGLYFGVSFAMRPISGPMVTVMDKKKLMIFAFALGVVVNLGYAASRSVGLFVASRVIHGVQFSLIGSLGLTVASDSLPKEKMGSGIGIFGLSGIVGTAFGPSLGLALRELGEQALGEGGGFLLTFLVAALLSGVSVIPCLLIAPQPKPDRSAAALGPWYKNIVAVDAIPAAAVTAILSTSSILANSFMVPYAVQYGLSGIGLYFTVNAVASLISRPFTGRLLDKMGPAVVFYPGAAMMGVALLLIGLVHTMPAILLSGALTGIGWGTVSPLLQSMALQVVPPSRRGVASNTSYLGFDLGLFVGPTLAGLIVAQTGSYGAMFTAGAVPILLGIVVFALTWKHYKARVNALQTPEPSSRD